MDGFLTEAEIAELHAMMDMGNRTVQAFQRPAPVVDFMRMSESGGAPTVVAADVALISITFGLREGQQTGFAGVSQTYADGDIRMWATGFIPQVKDFFLWDGHPVYVTKVFPENQGTVTAEVSLQQVTR